MIEIADVRSLAGRLEQELVVSDWMEITQSRITQFADATEDRQWIHVDVEAASASPFRTTIAHGFLTLSLISALGQRAMRIGGLRMAINYGLNKVRFVSPVPAGAKIRGRFTPAAISEEGGCVQVTWRVTVEREGLNKPCCVAEWVVRYYPL